MTNASSRTMKVLLVDDDPTNLILLKKMLSFLGDVQTADSGAQALTLFSDNMRKGTPYELIFLDIMMPGLSGHEVLETMRSEEQGADIIPGEGAKVIMLTAADDESNIFEAHINGCEGYLIKPFSHAQIQEKLLELGIVLA